MVIPSLYNALACEITHMSLPKSSVLISLLSVSEIQCAGVGAHQERDRKTPAEAGHDRYSTQKKDLATPSNPFYFIYLFIYIIL